MSLMLARTRPDSRYLCIAGERSEGRFYSGLLAGALAVCAPGPAAGSTLAFFELLLGPANTARPGRLLLGILDPADELVAGQRRDVLPRIEYRAIGDERLAQVSGKLVHPPTGHSHVAHGVRVPAG